jgi:hypothetical protein
MQTIMDRMTHNFFAWFDDLSVTAPLARHQASKLGVPLEVGSNVRTKHETFE